jgi:hypothetical protein
VIIASPGKRDDTLLVMGSASTRAPNALQESLETMMAGRVFRISVPMVGSNATQ